MKARRNLIQIWLVLLALSTLNLQPTAVFAQPVTQIAGGFYQSLFLKSDGSLWAMGNNNYGQLGDGTNINTNRPELIVSGNVTAIAAGFYHSLFLKSDGSLWAMGWNSYGQLGDGTYNSTNRPEQIVASNVTAIAAGGYHSLFLKSDGSLWAMGNNSYGQLGDGTYNSTNLPEQIVASNVTAIATGITHDLFLKSDGSLWAMGYNGDGELGDGTYTALLGGGTNLPEQIVASNVTAIAAGGGFITGAGPCGHSLFLKSDGSLWAMGDNGFGELGDGSTDNGNYKTNLPEQIVASNVMAIATGFGHSMFLKRDGSLWVMGWNRYAQLGDGTYNSTNKPEQIVASGVTVIATGYDHSLFLKNDGSLWGMGYGVAIGDGTSNYTNRPEQIVVNPSYNQITGQLMGSTKMQLTFYGNANAKYALERSASLSPPNWIPQATNAAGSFGVLLFTNMPDATTNNFWRIRSVP
jgi:alpha-tubulin suppressor-like RCC1 family protein